MNRKMALEVIKVSGYHGDTKTFMQTYIENRISYQVAIKHWMLGKTFKANGVKCECSECKKQGVAA